MREILFRGKTRDGEWVKGFLYITQKGNYEINRYSKELDIERLSNFVIPKTLGQYTGLTDRNGKKIFEGDIVNWRFSPCVVKWDSINACYSLYQKGITKISGFNADTMKLFEVIGNIYDNPELLEV